MASYLLIPFAKYGTLANAKKAAPAVIAYGINEVVQGVQLWKPLPAHWAKNTAATLVHHILPAKDPAVMPRENPRSTDPLGDHLLSLLFTTKNRT